jgi:asparagine synthase (glutamine-hydrolysing)
MSGIYGVYRFDGAPIEPDWLERMRTAMAYYGPHGGDFRVEGPLGLGHLLLQTNPEDAFERQPVAGERGLVVSAARLDNRAELLEAFHASAEEKEQLSDGHLVGMAFDRWGRDLVTHIQGDWSLAAWDRKERRLLLARDAFGKETMYYYQNKEFIAFSSSLKALLSIPGIVKEPDLLRLVQVLASWQHNAELTSFMGFRRLVWAHALEIRPEGHATSWRYWSPEGREPLFYRRDEDYEEAFLEHYSRAVQSCLRTQKPVAATLSGGRDSGSVVAMAAPLLAAQGRDLTAYTSVPCMSPDGAGEKRVGNEWGLAHATATMAGANVRHVAIDAAEYGVLQSIEHFLDLHDGSSHAASNQYWLQAIAETAARDGFGVVLTGAMGNATVSWPGNGSAALAMVQGHPHIALQLLLHAESNLLQTIKRQVLKPVIQPARRLFQLIRSPRYPWMAYSALNPRMAAKMDLDGRMRAAGHDPTFTLSRLEDLRPPFFKGNFCVGAGIWSEMSARHAVSFLDPTANLSLVEFLLRVPDSQFRRNGQGSSLIRRALRNRLPDPILEGRQKGLQAADIGHRILKEQSAIQQCLNSFASHSTASELLDISLLNRCLQDVAAKVDPDTTTRAAVVLLRGVCAGLFVLRYL